MGQNRPKFRVLNAKKYTDSLICSGPFSVHSTCKQNRLDSPTWTPPQLLFTPPRNVVHFFQSIAKKNEPMPIRNQPQIYQTHKWLLSNLNPHVFCARCMLVPYLKCEKWIKLGASTHISHILLIVNKPPHLTIQSILEHLPYQDRLLLWQILLQVLWLCTPGQFNLFKCIFLPYGPTLLCGKQPI